MLRLLILLSLLTPLGAQAFDTKAQQAYVVDIDTGATLLAKEETAEMVPSSMSKLMTLYALFSDIKAGRISLEDSFTVSEKAWKKGGSKMFVEVGKQVKVEDLIRGIIVQSGNDACIVVAEGISGSEEAFAERLNSIAKGLGMTQSHFVNATGWPDEGHLTTAQDLAILTDSLIKEFPDFVHYFSESEFTYSGITQPNRNPLLGSDLGVTGMKTGHTEAGGYGIVLSAEQDNRRLVAVLNGMASMSERKEEGDKVLRYALNFYDNFSQAKAYDVVGSVAVVDGDPNSVDAVLAEPALVTIPKGKEGELVADTIFFSEALVAPLPEGTIVGSYSVSLAGQKLVEVPVMTAVEVPRAGFFKRSFDGLKRMIGGK